MTFRDPESARRACADPTPIIDGRRANCNLASLGRPRPSISYGIIFIFDLLYLENSIVSCCHVNLYDQRLFLVCILYKENKGRKFVCLRVFGNCGLISLCFNTLFSYRPFKTACSLCWRHATQQGNLYWKFWLSTTSFLCLSAGTCISSLWVCLRGSSLCIRACQYTRI